ncbi:MAG TPA: PASTA domain-containing protein [Gaiellaceae bacterium]|nr:PASTA domain-containing protein [Gaiellaceae bacterium]
MASRLAALLPRLVALTVIWLLATSTITFAAGSRTVAGQPQPAVAQNEQEVLTVPDVRRQAYVFAKGILEDAGFAWRVEGSVRGYAANTVTLQSPAPGVRVLDNGTPTVILRLARNGEYRERGLPQNSAPYPGDEVLLASEAEKADKAEKIESEPAPKTAKAKAPKPKPVKPVTTAAKTATKKAAERAGKPKPAREPAFEVPGAPAEPLDEMPLVQRARLLQSRISAHETPTSKLVKYWLYQHAWIVTGARFGWSGGAEALRILIAVDNDMQARWEIGARSEAVARATLAYVERRSR